MGGRRSPFAVRRIVLFMLNLTSTMITLFTGFRENPVLVLVTGRYDHIRGRLTSGTINYDNLRDDTIPTGVMPDLKHVGETYRLISSPRRSPENLDEDRSTCMYVNSLDPSMVALLYDDVYGQSAPHADLRAQHLGAAMQGGGNATLCHFYILEHFSEIRRDYMLQVGTPGGFGVVGVPMLRCPDRREREFFYYTDLVIQQQYWSGGSYHVEIQSSKCRAVPLVSGTASKWGLFQVNRTDYAADVVMAIDGSGSFVAVVTALYSIVAITLFFQGALAAVLRSRSVRYLPEAVRFTKEWRVLKFVFPFMSAACVVTEDPNYIITFKGSLLAAADIWMNHWLYIALSILESIVNIRVMYMVLEMGTWMLTMKLNFENFLFMCSALKRITWLLRGVHTLLRYVLKLALHSIKKLRVFEPGRIERIEWFVDAWALFMNCKIYLMLVCIFFAISLKMRGTTSFMQEAGVLQVLGGEPDIKQFWGSEIMCDMLAILPIVLASELVVTVLILQTKIGTIEALGIDPFNSELVGDDGICRTNCSFGAILQQLYTSGLSGYVNLASDCLFLKNGSSHKPIKLRYPVKRAIAMNLCKGQYCSSAWARTLDNDTNEVSSRRGMNWFRLIHALRARTSDRSRVAVFIDEAKPVRTGPSLKSLFERHLKIDSEGFAGKIVFVDEDHPGHVVTTAGSTLMDYEVEDALSTMLISDIKPLLGNEKKLHIH